MNGEIESGCRMLYRMQEVFSAVAQEPMSPKTPVTQSKRDFVHQALAIELSPIASKLVFSGPPPDAPTIPSSQGHQVRCQ